MFRSRPAVLLLLVVVLLVGSLEGVNGSEKAALPHLIRRGDQVQRKLDDSDASPTAAPTSAPLTVRSALCFAGDYLYQRITGPIKFAFYNW